MAAATDLEVSEPRRPTPECDDAPWVVDVSKGDKVLASLDVTDALLPPRKKNGRVVWALPTDLSKTPKLGFKDKERVLEAYKVQRKERKEANHEKAKESAKEQKKLDKKLRWGATRLQTVARQGFAAEAVRLKRQERAVAALAGLSASRAPPAPSPAEWVSVGARARQRGKEAPPPIYRAYPGGPVVQATDADYQAGLVVWAPAAPPPAASIFDDAAPADVRARSRPRPATPPVAPPRPRPPPAVAVDAPLADRRAWTEQWKARVVANLDDLARDAWAAAARRADAPAPHAPAAGRYAPPARRSPPPVAPLPAAPPPAGPPPGLPPSLGVPAAAPALPYGGDTQAAMRANDRDAIRQIMSARGQRETRAAPAAPPPGIRRASAPGRASPPTVLPEMPETVTFLRSSPLGIRL